MLPHSLRGSCWDTGDSGVWKRVPGPFCTGMLAATSWCPSGTSAGTSFGREGMLMGQSKCWHSQGGLLPTGAAASPISLLKRFEAPFVPCGGSVPSLPAEVETERVCALRPLLSARRRRRGPGSAGSHLAPNIVMLTSCGVRRGEEGLWQAQGALGLA